MFSQRTCESLKVYVYVLRDPEGNVFYVGKGENNRVYDHMNDAFRFPHINSEKFNMIRKLGKEIVQHEIIRHGMDSETAFEVEGALIDVYGLEGLKNIQNGHRNVARGRQPNREIEIRYGAEAVEITDPVFLGMISNEYDPFKTPDEEVLEVCRKFWMVNPYAHPDARYCLAIHRGIVRAVFTINEWKMATPPYNNPKDEGRYEFTGSTAPQTILDKYLHKDISAYISQNRKWINC